MIKFLWEGHFVINSGLSLVKSLFEFRIWMWLSSEENINFKEFIAIQSESPTSMSHTNHRTEREYLNERSFWPTPFFLCLTCLDPLRFGGLERPLIG